MKKYEVFGEQLAGFRPEGFQSSTLIFNWRGVVAGFSGKVLVAYNILKKRDMKILASRSLVGSTYIHRIYQRMTSSGRSVKKGVG